MSYHTKKQRLINDFLEIQKNSNQSIGLSKTTSNLFRDRSRLKTKRLNVRLLNQVIAVNPKNLVAECEGMTTYEDLVAATLEKGLVPLVVPELKTITVGGAVSGIGIESSSFKYGLVHEGVQSMDVLLASGEVVTATSDNHYRDLFYAIPNSYGSLGYVIKVTVTLRRTAPYIHLQHLRFTAAKDYFAMLKKITLAKRYKGKEVSFVDGAVFDPNELYITLGFDAESAPYTSDYTFKNIYHQSIRQRSEDYLSVHDYIWRWDTDWFWCSKAVHATNPILRRLLGRRRLGSRTYGKLFRLEQRYHIARRFRQLTLSHRPTEMVIQDTEVPIDKAEEFLAWFIETIGISPVWICPTKAATKDWPYPLYPMNPDKLYVNFGFWDTVPTNKDPKAGYYNKLVEAKVRQLGAIKMLYSNSYYNRADFEKIYNYKTYKKLKKKYDPNNYFKGLYEKTHSKKD